MVTIMSYELPLILVLLAVGTRGGLRLRHLLPGADNASSSGLSGPFLLDWRLIPAAVAMLLIIPCEVGAHPFDVGEAETEICEGPLVEYSGAPLAVFKLSPLRSRCSS